MKLIYSIIILFLLGFSLVGYSQKTEVENSSKIFFHEIYVSLNTTTPNYEGLHSEIGAGIGARGYFINDTSRFNITLGLEFNRNSVFVDNFSVSHFGSVKDVSVNLYCFSMPVNFHLNLGKKYRMIIEGGYFFDYGGGKATGTSTSFSPYTGKTTSGDYVKKVGSSFHGASIGGGIRIPYKSRSIVFRLDYKHGLKSAGGEPRGDYSYHFKNRQVRMVLGINL